MVKHLPTMQETQVRSLGWENPLEKEMATHSSTLAWKIPWMERRGRLQSMGSQRVGHDWATSLSLSLSSPSEGRQTENHNDRKLTNLITWATALSNSVKLWALPSGPPKMDGSWWRFLTKCGPLEKGIANHFSILALRTPMNSMKRQKDMTLKDELPRSVGAQYATGDQ